MIFPWRRVAAPAVAFLCLCASAVLAVPMSKEQLFQLATRAAGENEFDRAVELFQKIIEIDPRFTPAYNGLGLVHQNLDGGDLNEAVRYFKLATDISPDQFESWNNLGRAYYARARFVDAEKAFLRSLQIKADQPDIELALAWDYLLGQSRPEEALVYFTRAMPLRDDPMLHYGMGLAHLLKGDKFKVLDAVTQLRHHQREEQASKLEKMVRENIHFSSRPGTPLVTGEPGQVSLFDQQLRELEARGFSAQGKEGIKVRLKGPLL